VAGAGVVGAGLARAPMAMLGAGALLLAALLAVVAIREPRWLAVGMVALVVSYVPDVIGQRTPLPGNAGLIAFGVAVLVLRHAFGRPASAFPPETGVIVLVLFVMALSGLFASDTARSLAFIGHDVKYMAMGLLILAVIDTTAWLRRLFWAFAGAAAVLAGLALLQQLTRTYGFGYLGLATVTEDKGLLRSAGPLDPNFFAQTLLVAAVLAFYLRLTSAARRGRMTATVVLALCLGAAALTYSRGGLLALVVGTTAIMLLRGVALWKLAAAAMAVVTLGLAVLPGDVKTRLGEALPSEGGLSHAQDQAVAGRFAVNRVAVSMVADRPVLGVGPGNYSDRYGDYAPALGFDDRQLIGGVGEEAGQRPHSLYLETLAEGGIVGMLVLLGAFILAGRAAWRGRARMNGADSLLAEAALVALLVYLTTALFLHNAYPQFLWLVVGLPFLAGRVAPQRARSAT
jgi:O-antigen ligase